MKKIVTVIGARPNFIKAKLLSDKLKRSAVTEILVHTGQHYDQNLSEDLFIDLKLKKPDINLGIHSNTHGQQTGKMLIGIEKVLLLEKPNGVIVYGDTNSTLAGALAAAKLKIPIIHVEAGERSYLTISPEEINRVVCDHISTINCCPTKHAVFNLRKESITKNVIFTGDIMLDLFIQFQKKQVKPPIQIPKEFMLLTIHRAENTEDNNKFISIIKNIENIGSPIVWPVHPRSRKILQNIEFSSFKNIIPIPPVTYSQMLWLEANSHRIITDSGGVQKEAYWSNVPCLTLSSRTCWQQTLKGNWNQVVGDNINNIKKYLRNKVNGKPQIEEFGDGHALEKIYNTVLKII